MESEECEHNWHPVKQEHKHTAMWRSWQNNLAMKAVKLASVNCINPVLNLYIFRKDQLPETDTSQKTVGRKSRRSGVSAGAELAITRVASANLSSEKSSDRKEDPALKPEGLSGRSNHV